MYMMNGNEIALWAYGHTHWYHNMRFNGTRVVSNPHGYPRGDKKSYNAMKDDESPYANNFVVEV